MGESFFVEGGMLHSTMAPQQQSQNGERKRELNTYITMPFYCASKQLQHLLSLSQMFYTETYFMQHQM